MISHRHKFVFIHIPKTGGTTLEAYLLGIEGVERPNSLNDLSKENKKKYHLDHIKSQPHAFFSEIDSKIRKNYFSFTFVRNPFDRVVSEYNWDPQFRNVTFLNFLQRQHKWQKRHSNSQLEFIDENINFIGRFENFQEDFNTVCDKIGIPKQKLPHKNKSKHKHYTEYYDDETRQRVAEKYAKDIEYFNYKFGE